MEHLISVVVPVYNTEKYLERCLSSLCEQSYSKLEIIVVNDGSTDNSTQILEEYERRDSRVKVYHKTNGGLTSAVCLGVKQAAGEYIAFVDSDDYVDKDFILNFYSNIDNADVLSMGLFYQYDDTAREFNLLKDDIYSNDELIALQNDFIRDQAFGLSRKIFVARWNKLYKTALVKKIIDLYNELNLSYHEDSFFTFLIIHEAITIKTLVRANGYHYCVNPASMTRAVKKYENFLTYLDAIGKAKSLVEQRLGVNCEIDKTLIVFQALDYLKNYSINLPKKQAKQEMRKILHNGAFQKSIKSFHYHRTDIRGKIKLFLLRRKMDGLLYAFLKKKNG